MKRLIGFFLVALAGGAIALGALQINGKETTLLSLSVQAAIIITTGELYSWNPF